MLKITPKFRAWALKKWSLDADTTDKELQAFVGRKLLKRLVTSKELVAAGAIIKTAVKTPASGGKDDDKPKKKGKPAPKKKSSDDDDDNDAASDSDEIARQVRRGVKGYLKKLGITGKAAGDVDPSQAFTKATRIRVKEAADSYSTSKKSAVYPQFRNINGKSAPHPFAGMPAKHGDVLLDHPSDRDKAIALAFLRFSAARSMEKGTPCPHWLRMTDHDRELLLYSAHNEKWVGKINHGDGTSVIKRAKLNEFQIKTLLDDTISGGIEITPVVFDDALILTPVLYGELFPYVNVQTIARGRRVKGGSAINPTFTSGVAEGTAITPFNTSSFVSAFDTPIYPAVAAIELGQDFEEDSPVDLGGTIIEQFGLKALEWLDRVIAVGNGTFEPLGFFNATAATLINSVYGVGGPPTVSDYEGLMFGVQKQFRTEAGAYLAYVSNDYTYRKARAIQVGQGDERRVFGMDHAEYKLMGTDYKVQNNIPDGYAAYANLRRYRMYRRLGMQVRVETAGRQLALTNNRLIVVRMRYGGQPEIGGAFALCKDLQTS